MKMQANTSMMTGAPDAQKESVNHFIDTLDDPDLDIQLLLLNVADAEEMQKTIDGYQRGKCAKVR